MKHLSRPTARSRGPLLSDSNRLGTALCIALGTWLGSQQAAEAEDAEDPAVVATARELAISGVKLAQDGQCAEAVPKLERAEKLHHSLVVLTRLGDCYIRLGQLVAGVESLRAVQREPPPEGASDTIKQAYAEANTLVEATKPKLAKLTIRVTGIADTAAVSLSIDGKSMPSALLDAPQLSDPGEHSIGVTAPGYRMERKQVTLTTGGAETIELALQPDPEALKAAQLSLAESQKTSGAPAPEASVRESASDRPNHLPSYITWGVSAAALGVGAGFGFAALENKQALEDRCPNKVCAPDLEGLLDTSRMNATLATVATSVGIGGVALGAVLFWLESRSSDTAPTQTAATKPVTLRATARGFAVSF